ncbi:hypothetical protein COT64_01065 [Candidatus Shapirobacteria bacterium CG09_land_8_20_14_0_10_39_12]|uniref:DUF2029 domain-containing protein n=1 Tax=Candidatus Shapirobacteria bacterium CG09_land_8_20_14_0_10_39_12 TaxID=1974885 RepID=A0A2H0WS41_9BACT|nr:MAG: hypothetical protein COT64_01065 [Candidatus Shapirobacteria bacterium CG09_land_8_20_14_0_10_39_12]
MKLFKKENIKWGIVLFATLFHLFFYYSAFRSHALDKYFLPVTPGQDFFQIPNGAYSFIRGGDFQGNLKGQENAYINCCGVNKNVYHPAFSLLVGTFLQLFRPWTSFNLWLFLHLLTSVFIVVFLIKKFKNNPYLPTALVIYLLNSLNYYEILNNQYHFLLNLFVLLFVYELSVHGDSFRAGFYYFLALLVKPVGLLFLPVLIIKKRFKAAGWGLVFFLIISFIFWLIPEGRYYFSNLSETISSNHFDWDIFHVFHYFLKIDLKNALEIRIILALILLLLNLPRRIKIFTAIFCFTLYQLLFYQSSFPYHHSILASFLAIGILLEEIKLGVAQKIAIFFITIPAPLFLDRLIFTYNPLEAKALVFLSWSYVGEILLLAAILIASLKSIRPINKNV